jgi:hypothetical protein
MRDTKIKEGIVIGKKKGLAIQTVVKSFKNGASIDFISAITDLSKEEITSILQKQGLIS